MVGIYSTYTTKRYFFLKWKKGEQSFSKIGTNKNMKFKMEKRWANKQTYKKRPSSIIYHEVLLLLLFVSLVFVLLSVCLPVCVWTLHCKDKEKQRMHCRVWFWYVCNARKEMPLDPALVFPVCTASPHTKFSLWLRNPFVSAALQLGFCSVCCLLCSFFEAFYMWCSLALVFITVESTDMVSTTAAALLYGYFFFWRGMGSEM